MPKTRTFSIWCPKGDQCTKKGKSMGNFPSEQAARDRLYSHLSESPYHDKLTEKQIEKLVEQAEVEYYDHEESEPSRPSKKAKLASPTRAPPPVLKPRERSSDPTARSSGVGGGTSAAARQEQLEQDALDDCMQEVASLAAEKAAEAVVARLQPQHPPSSALASAVLDQAAAAVAPIIPGDEDVVTLPRAKLLSIADHMARAEHAARQAARVASAAAMSFSSEADVLAAAQATLRELCRPR